MTQGETRYINAFLNSQNTIECAFSVWKCIRRSLDKTGWTLCYTPYRVCKLFVATMCCGILILIIIYNEYRYIRAKDTISKYIYFPSDVSTSNASTVPKSIIANYFG